VDYVKRVISAIDTIPLNKNGVSDKGALRVVNRCVAWLVNYLKESFPADAAEE
jgi:hypothetical protein